MSVAAIYPGTFDPLTLGHLDVIERGSKLFDQVIVGVAVDTPKQPLFNDEERVAMVKETVKHIPHVTVESFQGLLVDFAVRKNVQVVLRGLRAFSDFEFEFQMALTNQKMRPEIETMFLMTKEDNLYVSSTMVRQVAELGGDISMFVPETVQSRLQQRLGSKA